MSNDPTQAPAPESQATQAPAGGTPSATPPPEAGSQVPSNGTAPQAVDTSSMSMDQLIEAMSVPDHDPMEHELIEDAVESANSLEEYQAMLQQDNAQQVLSPPPAQPEAPAPAPAAEEAEPPSILETPELEAAPAATPAVDPVVAQLMQQNQQILATLAQQQQAPQQQGLTDDQIASEIERLGGDPADPFHVAYFTDRLQRNQQDSGLAQQVAQMRQDMQALTTQAQQIRTRGQVGTQVDQALRAYGSVPAETADAIKDGAAALVQAGHEPVAAIRAAAGPFLPLLRAMKAQPTHQPAAQAAPAASAALTAAALPGSGTGTKKLSEVPMGDLLGMMFS